MLYPIWFLEKHLQKKRFQNKPIDVFIIFSNASAAFNGECSRICWKSERIDSVWLADESGDLEISILGILKKYELRRSCIFSRSILQKKECNFLNKRFVLHFALKFSITPAVDFGTYSHTPWSFVSCHMVHRSQLSGPSPDKYELFFL